jgi:hypothetical protein
MPNKKINQLDTRTGAALTDLILIGDPTSGTSFKLTGTDFRTLLNNVPYTGATTNVNLGAFNLTAASIIKSGGTSSQFLKADGSVDSSVYITGITSGNVTTALGFTPVPTTRTLTINGTTFDLSADRSWTIAAGITGSGVANQLTYWNGTGSVTGSAGLTYNDSTGILGLTKNQNAATSISITNTNNNANSDASLVTTSNSGNSSFGKMSTGRSYKIISGGDAFIYNATGDLAIQNDIGGGKIKFASGNSSTAHMTITSAGRLLLGTTTESTFLLDVSGTARVSGNLTITQIASGSNSVFGVNSNNSYYFNNVGAGVGDQNLAIGSSARALGSYGIAINNAQAQSGGIAISYTRADSGDFAAASAITFNGLVPISNVYFGSGKYRQNPDGSFTTGAGADYTINGSGASGTNLAGGTITIAGGKGTGSGASGDVVISTATTTTSGTTLQTLTPRLEVFGNTGNVLIQSGGTFTDAGFRLDVNGTARVSGATTISAATSGTNYSLIVSDTNANIGSTIALQYSTQSLFIQARINGSRIYTASGYNYLGFVNNSNKLILGGNETETGLQGVNVITDTGSYGDGFGLLIVDRTGNIGQGAGLNFYSANQNNYLASIRLSYGAGFSNIDMKFMVNTSSVLTEAMRIFGITRNLAINSTTDIPSAQLSVTSTTKGFLPPRMTTTQKNAISTPAAGLQVYDTTLNQMSYYNGTTWINF